MTSDLHQHAEQIFSEAIDRNGSARIAFLEEACLDDLELRQEVESLISHYETTEGMLTSPSEASHQLTTGIDDEFSIARTGAGGESLIGSYRIIKTLQDCEQGTSYLVEQDSPPRTCRLDLYQPLPDRSRATRRFRVLGDQLDHFEGPGIPIIQETGTTDTGRGQQPFVVTEYIETCELLEYASTSDTRIQDRVKLLRAACRILMHAHTIGVVHGDLRPATLLVDTEGQVVILDTGIAIALGLDRSIAPGTTSSLESACCAPESIFGTRDTRGDIYALGVLGDALIGGLADQGLRAVLDRAMQNDPNERYQSMDALASELDRWLHGKPLEAGDGSFITEVRSLARRHPVASACTIILAIIVLAACIMLGSFNGTVVDEPATGAAVEQPVVPDPVEDPGTGSAAGSR